MHPTVILLFFFPIGVGAAVIDNYLYVVGGHSGSSYLNTVQKYDPISDTWLDSAGMMYCRCNFGLTALWWEAGLHMDLRQRWNLICLKINPAAGDRALRFQKLENGRNVVKLRLKRGMICFIPVFGLCYSSDAGRRNWKLIASWV